MNLTSEELDVLVYIPCGSKNAISRQALAAASGYSDRKVRQIIAQLQTDGYMICNFSNGSGYFVAEDPDDIERFYRQEYARAMSILKRLKYMRRFLKLCGRKVK